MINQSWILLGILAWLAGYLLTRFLPKRKMLKVWLPIYILFGLPSGFSSRGISFEGFRLQLLGFLLILMPVINKFTKIGDVYLLLGSLGFSTLIAFAVMQMQE